jgi:hypothetical protein
MTRDAGWGAINAKLKALSAKQLVTLVRDLYQASPENRQFLQGRLVPTAADLEKCRSRVVDAVYPDPFSRKRVRVGEAERLIRHYRLSTGDESGAVDLMLSLVEAGTECERTHFTRSGSASSMRTTRGLPEGDRAHGSASPSSANSAARTPITEPWRVASPAILSTVLRSILGIAARYAHCWSSASGRS